MASLSKLRQVLANLYARRIRVDRLELAPDFGGRIGLHIKAVVLAEAPGEKHIDAGTGLTRRPGCPIRFTHRCGPKCFEMICAQPDKPNCPRLQCEPATES